ncbi:MAG TPA: hypothetical protein VNT30_00065 [Stellaceae bacterium]|nr:hypothetical protein [Stellaceae bacterium]
MSFLTAAVNLVVAVAFIAWWPDFIAVFSIASKMALFSGQLLTVRALTRPLGDHWR